MFIYCALCLFIGLCYTAVQWSRFWLFASVSVMSSVFVHIFQVVVGGRNKYMINGTAASNQKVADLFKSVSLNINNPHFLIMQGRVTKVLNMKPAEILSMVEEAAGTSLYESKRENAERVIEKKEGKLREIDALIEEETAPKLERLKRERDSYVEYQKTVREIEHLTKLHIAWQVERNRVSVFS